METSTLLLVALLSVGVSFAADLSINELMAKNDATVADQDGEYDDWIELYNNGSQALSLSGYYLSDHYATLDRWAFPDTVIAPYGFLIVWVDDDEDQTGLHANFKLSASGDVIYLFSSQAGIVDKIVFGARTADVSLGRWPDGSGDIWEMAPTFAAPNNGSHLGETDSSRFVFGETTIHNIRLHFYVNDWENQLKHHFEVLDKEYMPVQLTFDDAIVLDSVGVRYKGNSSYTLSRSTPKKPFKFRFDKYKENQTLYDLLKLNLSNGVSDPTFMRESIALSIARRYVPAPRTSYANLYVDGELIGFYVLLEQIDRPFLMRHFDDPGFNLYKASNDGATLKYQGEQKEGYESALKLKTNRDDDDWSDLISLLDNLNNTPRSAFVETMSRRLNLDNVVLLLAFNMVLSNFDSYTGSGRNFYLYNDRTAGKFNFIAWDLNESFGVFKNNWNVIAQDIDVTSNLNQRPLIKRILEIDAFKRSYWQCIEAMILGPASADSVAAMADRLKPLIESYVQADENKLYDYRYFTEGIENDVAVELGRVIPGLKSFSQARNANLFMQLSLEKVYPGDADNNGVVNEFDVLPLGVYFLTRGPRRGITTFAWAPQRTALWDTPAATYADVNGDGIVDEKDLIGVGVNWDKEHDHDAPACEIDPDNLSLLKRHVEQFRAIYYSLSGENEAVIAIKSLLRSILDIDDPLPLCEALYQNYPNPFNRNAEIGFYLNETQPVRLAIYDALGQLVTVPIDRDMLLSGFHRCRWDGQNFPAGVYFYRLETPNRQFVRRMILSK